MKVDRKKESEKIRLTLADDGDICKDTLLGRSLKENSYFFEVKIGALIINCEK